MKRDAAVLLLVLALIACVGETITKPEYGSYPGYTRTPDDVESTRARDPRVSVAAGGTYYDSDLGLVGTAGVFDPTVLPPPVQIIGPAGWNGGNPLNVGVYRPRGTSPRRSIWWHFVTPVTGSYVARSPSPFSGVIPAALFTVDAASSLSTPRIQTVSQLGGGRTRIVWLSQPDNQSCLVRVNDVPWPGFALSDDVVPCALGDFVTAGLPLVAGRTYQAVVFAFSQDVTGPAPIVPGFNIGADDRLFVASGATATSTDAADVQAAGNPGSAVPPSPQAGRLRD